MDLRDSRTGKLILMAILAGGLLYVHFGTRLLPFSHRARAEEIGSLTAHHAELSDQLLRARRSAAQVPELEREYARLERQWAQAEALLPGETEMAALLRDITLRGQQRGIEFTLFKPLPAIGHEFYSERPIEVRIEGSYHAIAECLNEMARMDRIVHVHGLDIEQIPDGERDEHGPTARAHFVVTAYVLGGSGPEGAAGGEDDSGGEGFGSKVKRLVTGRSAGSAGSGQAADGGSDE